MNKIKISIIVAIIVVLGLILLSINSINIIKRTQTTESENSNIESWRNDGIILMQIMKQEIMDVLDVVR